MHQIQYIQGKYFSCSSLKNLFENVNNYNFIVFIKEIHFHDHFNSAFIYQLNSLDLIILCLLTCLLAFNIYF